MAGMSERLGALKEAYTTGGRRVAARQMERLGRTWITPNVLSASGVTVCILASVIVYFEYEAWWLFLVGSATFLIGSVLCGLARTMPELIAFRAVQGLGGGGLMVGAQAALGDVVPPRQRGRYTGLFIAIFGAASVAGPLLGGFITSHLSWEWIFYINLPLGFLAFAVLAAAFPSVRSDARPSIDVAGSFAYPGLAAGQSIVQPAPQTCRGGAVYRATADSAGQVAESNENVVLSGIPSSSASGNGSGMKLGQEVSLKNARPRLRTAEPRPARASAGPPILNSKLDRPLAEA